MAESEDEEVHNEDQSSKAKEQQTRVNSILKPVFVYLDGGDKNTKLKPKSTQKKEITFMTKQIKSNECTNGKTFTQNDEEKVDVIVMETNESSSDSTDLNIEIKTNQRIELPQENLISCKRKRIENLNAECIEQESSPENMSKIPKQLTNSEKHPLKHCADGLVTSTDMIDSNNEETYFALSLVGILKRLPAHKKALAKCHILNYLTELEYGSISSTST